eukprot:757021-Hanusia_phi.AAC.1
MPLGLLRVINKTSPECRRAGPTGPARPGAPGRMASKETTEMDDLSASQEVSRVKSGAGNSGTIGEVLDDSNGSSEQREKNKGDPLFNRIRSRQIIFRSDVRRRLKDSFASSTVPFCHHCQPGY